MIDDGIELYPGMVVRHDGGLLYEIDGVRLSTVGYEDTGRFAGSVVTYTQLEAGKLPANTKYAKDEFGFRQHFTVEPVHSEAQ